MVSFLPGKPFPQKSLSVFRLERDCLGEMINSRPTGSTTAQIRDKQLQGIALESVLEKRRLDQALNAKEFAVCAGVSYSTARSWFHLPGFPAFRGVIFWQDFVAWRTARNACPVVSPPKPNGVTPVIPANFPPRAAKILLEA
jgi:hypothetical protein